MALPIIFIYPLFNVFFMFTADGYCSQTRGPFGSVIVGFQGSMFGVGFRCSRDSPYTYFQLRNAGFLLANNIFWMSATIINNSILLVKLVHLKSSLSLHARSQKSYKAEVSLTLTTVSMIFSYLSNSMIVVRCSTSELYKHSSFR